MISTEPLIWISAILSLMILSFLYKETILYRIAEHITIGATAGYVVVISLKNVKDIAISPLMGGDVIWIIPIILGLLLFTRFSKKYYWLSRYTAGYMVGVGTGLSLRSFTHAQLTEQIVATLQPLTGVDVFTAFNNFIVLAMVVAIIWYFIFDARIREKHSSQRYLGRLGRIAVMFSFGATYGNVVSSRMANLIERLQFFLFTWLGLG